MNMATQFIMLGEEKGIQKGIEKGIQKEKRSIALTLMKEGLDFFNISRITDLPVEELEQLEIAMAQEQ